jgi:prepilin-type N-terminal cleavage/methylation domain-containing protein
MATRSHFSFIRGRARLGPAGFSLIEVLAAVAIFGIGMLVVFGLFGPVTHSVSSVGEAESAARVADAVRARLQALPYGTALTLVQEVADVRKHDGDGSYHANDGKNPAVIFGKITGEIGLYDPANNRKRWYDSTVPTPQPLADADKYFEVDLIRNDSLSPKVADGTGAMVAYTIRVRWPAFLPSASGTAVQVGVNLAGGAVPYDQSKKQVMYFSGALLR